MRIINTLVIVFIASFAFISANAASILSWGSDTHNQVTGTPSGNDFIAIAGGGLHSVALSSAGGQISLVRSATRRQETILSPFQPANTTVWP